jgi:hypothetical protein
MLTEHRQNSGPYIKLLASRILLWPRFIRRFLVAPKDSPLEFRARDAVDYTVSLVVFDPRRRPILIAKIKD